MVVAQGQVVHRRSMGKKLMFLDVMVGADQCQPPGLLELLCKKGPLEPDLLASLQATVR